MTPFNPRLVFAAVVAFTDKETKDGRILSTPESFTCPVRELPVPVFWTPPNHHGVHRPTFTVGRIEQAYVIDHRLIAFGHLEDTEEIRLGVVPLLQQGARFLEIDVDSGDVLYDLDPVGDDLYLTKPVKPITFKDWRLRCAWIGDQPCWDLPLVQIEEITR